MRGWSPVEGFLGGVVEAESGVRDGHVAGVAGSEFVFAVGLFWFVGQVVEVVDAVVVPVVGLRVRIREGGCRLRAGVFSVVRRG